VILFLACTHDAGDSDVLPFEPQSGSYVVTMDKEFEGCALEDMKTGHVVDDQWDFLIDGDGIRWWGNDQTSRYGTMDGLDFFFDLGTYPTDYSGWGYDALEAITYSMRGTFDSPTSFTGSWEIAVRCEGADCAYVGTGWGKDFVYPCVASAAFVGTAAE